MKVLVAHNRYRSALPSGENAAVAAEVGLLRASGIEVIEFMTDSDEIARNVRSTVDASLGPVVAPFALHSFTRLVDREHPDIVHLHNVAPLISPMVIRSTRRRGIPVVQTVHNYRHSCLNGQLFRDGAVCTLCVGRRWKTPGVRHTCYRDSRPQSLATAVGTAIHTRTWQQVSRYIALTPFMREQLSAEGIPRDRIVLRGSWTHDPGPPTEAGEHLLFIGRLDESKGVRLLLDAWERTHSSPGRKLLIAGDGPLADLVRARAAADASIEYLGTVRGQARESAFRRCGAVLLPSLWPEGFPLTMVEAWARGRPVIVGEGGGPASVMDEKLGWVVPLDGLDVAALISRATTAACRTKGVQARQRYLASHSPDAATASLMGIYDQLKS